MTEPRRGRRTARPAASPRRAGGPPQPLNESELGYSVLLEQASDAILVTDGDLRILHVNARACEMFGFDRDEWRRMNVADIPTAAELAAHPLELGRLRQGRPVLTQRQLRRKDGTVITAETNATLLSDGRIVAIVRDITGRLDTETRLAESEARYGAVVEYATVGITVTDADWRFVEVNPRACEIFGCRREELLGRRVFELATSGDPGLKAAEVESLRAGRVVQGVRHLRRPDGTERDVEISARGLAGGHVVSIVTDVTDHLEAERRLAESEARYTAVVAHATVGITVTDAEWRFTEVNPSACEIFGRSREELLGMTVREIAAPGELEDTPLKAPVLNAGRDSFSTRRVRRPDGVERIVEIGARSLGGGHVVSIVTDVTDRVEAALRLAESERSLARAQEVAHFGTWEMEVATGAARCSAEAYRLSGLRPDSGPLTYERLIGTVHPEDRAGIDSLIRASLEGGVPLLPHEYRVQRADGSVRVLSGTVTTERDVSGKVVRLVGSVQDVTERRLLEAQLREAQKLEAIGRLAGGVAHDFNNLLTVILGFVETMLDGMPEGDRQRGGAEQIRLAARRAAGLTQQLLAFGRRQMFRLEVFDLNEVLGEMREILRRLIGEQIEITISPGARVATIKADRGQIEQVVLNLALNARDAMPAGGRLAIATANVDPPGGWPAGAAAAPCLVLTVTDTGIGMSPELQAHIFEPFYTTKDVGQGTGLGLATVHGIVSQTGGRIEVRSAPGQGTRFLVHLPCAVDEAAPAAGPPAAPLGGGDETVLVVEDDDAVRSLVAEVLRRRGYQVLEAVEGEQAVDLVGRHAGPLHLLLTDVVMPGMGGQDLARRLLGLRPGLRVLLISGYSGERGDPVGPLTGAMAFLQKPFSPGALVGKVREVLDLPAGAQGGG
jgi:two-component system cell cycle sensor histidine kinase/response regulator CckA